VARVGEPGGDPNPRQAVARRWLKAVGLAAMRVAPIVALLVIWELAARSGAFTQFVLPAFSVAAERIWVDAISGELWRNISLTIYRALAGFLIGGAVGIALGLAIAGNRFARWFFDPIISVGFPMPKVAFLPVIILLLGVFETSKITMISIESVFPVVTATVIGIQGVDRELLWSARNMGASERELLWQVLLPAALPQIMTGFQVAMPIALIVAIFSEMAMGGYGLGGSMMIASRYADSPGVFAGIVEIAVVGYLAVRGMAILRRRLLIWHQEAVAPSTV
jgi:ABC-type nitrate/sulfonate/bicarbonate transport system permease component